MNLVIKEDVFNEEFLNKKRLEARLKARFSELGIEKDSDAEEILFYILDKVFVTVYDDTLEVTNLSGLVQHLYELKAEIKKIKDGFDSSRMNNTDTYQATLDLYEVVFTQGIDSIIAKYEAMISNETKEELPTKESLNSLFTREESKLKFGIDGSLMKAFQIGDQRFGVFKIYDDNRQCFSHQKDMEIIPGTDFLICQFDAQLQVHSPHTKGLRAAEPVTLGRDHLPQIFTYDALVSRAHVRVELVNGAPEITDLGSTNGTEELSKEQVLVPMETVAEPEAVVAQQFVSEVQAPVEPLKNQNAEIIGKDNEATLSQSVKRFTSKFGSEIAAGSDKGIDYKKHNEDRVVVVPDSEFFAVVDGMGGYGGGDVAAQIIANHLSKNPGNIEVAMQNAEKAIANAISQKVIENEKAGAAFISAQIVRSEKRLTLEYSYAGDCALVVLDKNGTIKHVGKKDSLVAKLVEAGAITADAGLYHPRRNVAMGAIQKNNTQFRTESLNIASGDRVILMSDGIDDNLTPEEIAVIIKNKSVTDAIFAIDQVTSTRMQNEEQIIDNTPNRAQTGRFSDGYKSEPKKDNRGILIVDVE